MRLLPREEEFFDLFTEVANRNKEAAEFLRQLFEAPADRRTPHIEALKRLEHEADQVTHEVVNRLDRTFITPLDREDIVGLASKIDDVTDVCYDVSELVQLFKVKSIRPPAVRQAKVLVSAASEMLSMLKNLEGLKNLEPHWIKIHTLENEGDQVWREAVAELFAGSDDAIEIIKWKDIYSLVEVAIDRCEDVANIVETIKVKHS